jgi:hypothetical protein
MPAAAPPFSPPRAAAAAAAAAAAERAQLAPDLLVLGALLLGAVALLARRAPPHLGTGRRSTPRRGGIDFVVLGARSGGVARGVPAVPVQLRARRRRRRRARRRRPRARPTRPRRRARAPRPPPRPQARRPRRARWRPAWPRAPRRRGAGRVARAGPVRGVGLRGVLDALEARVAAARRRGGERARGGGGRACARVGGLGEAPSWSQGRSWVLADGVRGRVRRRAKLSRASSTWLLRAGGWWAFSFLPERLHLADAAERAPRPLTMVSAAAQRPPRGAARPRPMSAGARSPPPSRPAHPPTGPRHADDDPGQGQDGADDRRPVLRDGASP